MKVSIITVSYNSAATIEDTIQSVLSQKYSNIEYIVVDGASTDNTMEIINKYKGRINTIISEPDNGIYDGINKGIAAATGDVVGLLHSDDVYYDENAISKIANQFSDKAVESVYANLVFVDREDTNIVKRYWKSTAYVKGLFLKGWMPAHPTFFAKRECFHRMGQYNLNLKQSADYELMLRFLHKYNISTTHLDDTIVKMRLGGKSTVSIKNRIMANIEDRMAWKMNKVKPAAFTLIRKPLSKVGQFFAKPETATLNAPAHKPGVAAKPAFKFNINLNTFFSLFF